MDEKSKLEEITDSLQQYVITNLQLAKLEAAQKVSSIVPNILSGTIISVIAYLGILFLSLGLSIYLSVIFNSPYLGFVLIGIFYIILGVVLFALRKKIIHNPIRDLLIKEIFKKN